MQSYHTLISLIQSQRVNQLSSFDYTKMLSPLNTALISKFSSQVLLTLESIISLILTCTIITPFLISVYLINSFTRFLVKIYLKSTNKKYTLTSRGLGNIWGYRTVNNTNCRNVLSLVVYDEEIDGDRYKDCFLKNVINYKTKDGKYPYENLKKIFTRKCGYYCWMDDEDFDINNHVIVLEKDVIVKESELFKLLEQYSKDMDDTHPQWQEIIIPKFEYDISRNIIKKENYQSVRILRFHHSFGDAGSFIMLYSHCMADGKIPYAVDPLKGYEISTFKILMYYTIAFVMCAVTVMRSVWGGTCVKANRLLTKKYSGKRFYAWSDILDLNLVKEIKLKTHCSIPSILASVIGASLAKFDKKFPGLKPGFAEVTEMGAVAAILPYPDLTLTNRFTIANFGVPTTGDIGRLKRLTLTDGNLKKLIRSPEPILNYWMFDFFGMFPSLIQNVMMGSAGTSIVFSNLPGAKEAFYLNGDEVVDGGAWVPLLTVAGLSISTAGYKDGLRICAGTDSACMSDIELRFILDGIVDEIECLFEEVVGRV